ncbi:MAG: hypothetical protein MUE63_13615 [Xanthomonadales bacterium]|nr:hypothetical protein [Xanthomonadales bacterium]
MKPTLTLPALPALLALLAFALSSPLAHAAASAENYDLVIRNGRVMNPANALDSVRDVGIRDGRIAALSREPLSGDEEVDASGLVVAPGFIDLHAHGQREFEAWTRSTPGTQNGPAPPRSTTAPRPATSRCASPPWWTCRPSA